MCYLFKEIGIRWEPPPISSQNGVITGYKIRYRKQDKKMSGDTITTAGDHTEYQISGLEKSSVSKLCGYFLVFLFV